MPRAVGAFSGIALAAGAIVEVRHAATNPADVETVDNIRPLIQTAIWNVVLQTSIDDRLHSIRATDLRLDGQHSRRARHRMP